MMGQSPLAFRLAGRPLATTMLVDGERVSAQGGADPTLDLVALSAAAHEGTSLARLPHPELQAQPLATRLVGLCQVGA